MEVPLSTVAVPVLFNFVHGHLRALATRTQQLKLEPRASTQSQSSVRSGLDDRKLQLHIYDNNRAVPTLFEQCKTEHKVH